MNPIARRKARTASNLVDADEAKRQAALNLTLALRKAQRDQDAAVDEAVTEVLSALGFDVAASVEPVDGGEP